jgi:DNA polymerase III epsilon subunit family exonuclease
MVTAADIFTKEELENAKFSTLPDRCVVFDTETTGLTPRTDSILEIGAVLFDKEDYKKTGEIQSFQIFIKQSKPIPKEATAINKITDDMVLDGVSEYEALTNFFEFVGEREVYAYNAKFDRDFITETAKRCGYHDTDYKFKVKDILKIVRESCANEGLYDFKLATVAKHFEIEVVGAHRALKDSVMALQVFVRIQQQKAIALHADVALELEGIRTETERLQKENAALEIRKSGNGWGWFVMYICFAIFLILLSVWGKNRN